MMPPLNRKGIWHPSATYVFLFTFIASVQLSSTFAPSFRHNGHATFRGTKSNVHLQSLKSRPLMAATHRIESTDDGPSDSLVHTLTIDNFDGASDDPIVIQTGKIGRQAAGAVTLTRGETVIYATASRDKDPKESIDFLPLSVEYQERFSSVGQTSGGYNKRDGRPAEHEILTCRLIDRPLRPLIANGWKHETQLLSWVLSYDNKRSSDTMAIIANSAALWLSDVPLIKPVAAATVGLIDGELVVNPTNEVCIK